MEQEKKPSLSHCQTITVDSLLRHSLALYHIESPPAASLALYHQESPTARHHGLHSYLEGGDLQVPAKSCPEDS